MLSKLFKKPTKPEYEYISQPPKSRGAFEGEVHWVINEYPDQAGGNGLCLWQWGPNSNWIPVREEFVVLKKEFKKDD